MLLRTKTIIQLLLVLSFSVISAIAAAKNSFLVAPGRVDFDLNKPTTQSFILTNNGDGPIRLSIEPIYFQIDDKSLAAGIHLKPETAQIEDITSSIRVSPRRVSLQPGQRRDIRISLRPDKNLAPGDYRSHLLVKMLETAHVIKSTESDGQSVGMELSIKMETAVAVYGHKGERDPKLSFTCSGDAESGNVLVTAVNNSVWRFDGFFEVFNANGPTDKPLYSDRLISLRESKQDLLTSWKASNKGPFLIRWSHLETEEQVGSTQCSLP